MFFLKRIKTKISKKYLNFCPNCPAEPRLKDPGEVIVTSLGPFSVNLNPV